MRLHFDAVATKLEREVKYVTEPTCMFAGVEQEVTRGHPSQDAFGADISVGYDFETHRLSFGPRIGVEFNRYEQSAYAESLASQSSDGPLFPVDSSRRALPAAVAFDELSENSLTHRIGVNVALLPTRPKSVAPSLEVLWVHEYLDVQHVVTGHLVEDIRANPTTLRFLTAERSRYTVSARLGFGIRVAPRVTVVVTAELGYSSYAYYSSGFIEARGKF